MRITRTVFIITAGITFFTSCNEALPEPKETSHYEDTEKSKDLLFEEELSNNSRYKLR